MSAGVMAGAAGQTHECVAVVAEGQTGADSRLNIDWRILGS